MTQSKDSRSWRSFAGAWVTKLAQSSTGFFGTSANGAGLTFLEADILLAAAKYYINRPIHRQMVGFMEALIMKGLTDGDSTDSD